MARLPQSGSTAIGRSPLRRLAWILGITVILLGILALAGWLAMPRIGNWYVRTRVVPRLEARLGRTVTIKKIAVSWGQIELTGITVKGKRPDDPPLLEVARVHATFEPWQAVKGNLIVHVVTVEQPVSGLKIAADGSDNFSDVIESWRKPQPGAQPGGPARKRFDTLHLERGAITIDDARHGITLLIGDLASEAEGEGPATVTLSRVEATSRLGLHAAADHVMVHTSLPGWRKSLSFEVAGGELGYHDPARDQPGAGRFTWPDLDLTGIHGTARPLESGDAAAPPRVQLDMAGGYGGAPEELWRAEGKLDLARGGSGEVHLRADRFSFEKLAPILAGTPVQHPENTNLDATVDVSYGPDLVAVSGGIHVTGLTLYHHLVADVPVPDIAFAGSMKAHYDRKAKIVELEESELEFRGVKATLTAQLALAGGLDAVAGGAPVVRAQKRMAAHLVVPSVPCQQALAAFPAQLVPNLVGFRLVGDFTTDLRVGIDWANVKDAVLDGSVGIDGCRVVAAPTAMDARRLEHSFEHHVQVTKDTWMDFVIGPENDDFVPLAEISPYVPRSILSTEDSGFYKHRGFVTREFRSALVRNLEAGYFKFGASSITMQFVKNILLDREKTLSRKLQELFLTWYVEKVLDKDRILEIYLNAIEFGPGLYGIGAAARHYFGKDAHDLNPVEAAFFSSILPGPKRRHMQYCDGQLTRFTQGKVQRILKTMFERGRLTEAEYLGALATPLAFAYPPDFDGKRCRREAQKIIDNAPSTMPEASEPADPAEPDEGQP